MSDAETLSVYAAKAQEYADMVKTEADKPMLKRFVADLPEGGVALDIGCGPGFAAGVMAAAGIEAHAWDPVPEMIALAATYSGVQTRQAGYGDLDAVAVYDGIWSNFSMLHTPLADWPDQFAAIARALKPGGLFHFGTKLGTGEARDSIGRMYFYMSEEALLALLTDTGFTVETKHTGEEAGLSGEVAPFIVLQARA
ncbi:methyltransferase domain-containing protein [Tateyamaria sp. SN3-11]|uniref:methyltransferase domain-containing protein n=1 Tax=Tateyamaria sp. SN3-11 TaxID=3092147 RepID=UPI0039EA3D6C